MQKHHPAEQSHWGIQKVPTPCKSTSQRSSPVCCPHLASHFLTSGNSLNPSHSASRHPPDTHFPERSRSFQGRVLYLRISQPLNLCKTVLPLLLGFYLFIFGVSLMKFFGHCVPNPFSPSALGFLSCKFTQHDGF